MIKVDLASKEAVKIAKANQLIDRLRMASVVVLGVFVLVVGSVYGFFFYTTNQVSAVDEDVQAVVAQISVKAESEVLYRRLVDVIEEADDLVRERKDFSGALLDVYSLLPDDVGIDTVRFEERVVLVDIRSSGVQGMSRALSILSTVSVEKNARFNEVALSSIRRSDNGSYVLRVELGLAEAI